MADMETGLCRKMGITDLKTLNLKLQTPSMKISEAATMVETAFAGKSEPEQWADLGCGSGVFTYALAGLLPAGSLVHAVDRDHQSFDDNKIIAFRQADFITEELNLPKLNGILMANSLHYVSEKDSFLDKLKTYLIPLGELIVIEYDTLHSNPWVPYPIDFANLRSLFHRHGYSSVKEISRKKSLYRRGYIYAAHVY